jgi:hypothetical protein
MRRLTQVIGRGKKVMIQMVKVGRATKRFLSIRHPWTVATLKMDVTVMPRAVPAGGSNNLLR